MISIVNPGDAAAERYSIFIKRGGAGDATFNNFWDYLEKLSVRFKGNLPCMLKMLYL
jgi:hypothetical protein